ncbi:dephospho-CoA kinase [Anaerorhabdus sp.]|uniref:dephospho-CoA kinase n=1 Tax=Anaerorhabdus sp. TaxID=1872524 RepID=UPI002FCAB250
MRKVAITGTIGSGKSECSKLIKKLGFSVFNCDEEVHKMYLNTHPAYQEIVNLFPTCVHEDGIHRNEIAKIIFSEDEKKKKLEKLIYHYLLPQLLYAMENEKKPIFFAEVPLLFENGWDKYFDECMFVKTRDEVAIERLVIYRNMDREDAVKRLENQKITIYSTIPMTIINNDDTVIELEEQINNWIRKREEN